MNCGYHPARLAASRNITSVANSVWLVLPVHCVGQARLHRAEHRYQSAGYPVLARDFARKLFLRLLRESKVGHWLPRRHPCRIPDALRDLFRKILEVLYQHPARLQLLSALQIC
jgi:hypothetical protein